MSSSLVPLKSRRAEGVALTLTALHSAVKKWAPTDAWNAFACNMDRYIRIAFVPYTITFGCECVRGIRNRKIWDTNSEFLNEFPCIVTDKEEELYAMY
ncbi:UNVERIFIED_CONTAM: hypothetical protein NCL1_34086 [Trichonephila clavipes]